MTRNIQQQKKWDNQPCLTCGETFLDEEMWNNISGDWVRKGTPIKAAWKRAVQQLDSCPHDNNKIWRMANAKIEGVTPKKIREIKNNLPEPIKLDWNKEPAINLLELEKFHEHYQTLAPTREKQEQCLCDLIYNPLPCMIYMILEEEKPINSYASELESTFNPDSNSNNDDDKNNGSSSAPNSKKNYDESNSDSNPETFIALLDLSKEQELK
ncbi:hypothetical protein G9A89_007926 [Geosiphon pyriformis]|nr:hypothetical protein G9A89_007926 [Geosiphon pyriformis]